MNLRKQAFYLMMATGLLACDSPKDKYTVVSRHEVELDQGDMDKDGFTMETTFDTEHSRLQKKTKLKLNWRETTTENFKDFSPLEKREFDTANKVLKLKLGE